MTLSQLSINSIKYSFLVKKSLSIIIVLVFVKISGNAQIWKDKFHDPKVNVNKLEIEFEQHWSNPNIDRSHRDYKTYSRLLQKMKKRTRDDGTLKSQMSIRELLELNRRNSQQHQGLSNSWRQIGPKLNPTRPNSNFSGVGRMTTIDWHPNSPNKLIAGASSGGVWISNDFGQSWFSPTDQLSNLGIYDIQIDPNNPDIVYAATGDFWSHVNTYGLIKSLNGGLTWEITGLIPEDFQNFTQIWKILVNPANSNLLTASTSHGVYSSLNGGQNWIQTSPYRFRHMLYHPQNPDIIYAATGHLNASQQDSEFGFFYSPDKGMTWIQTHTPNIRHFNSRIDVIESEPNNVYIMTAANQNGSDLNILFKSTDNGISYDSISNIPESLLSSQRNINWTFSVDPSNPNDLYVGSVTMVKSQDGGASWARVICSYDESCVHVDYHQSKFFGNSLFMATDGGIYSTDDSGQTWNDHSRSLETTQYYRHSNAESNLDFLLGGAQDNGTHKYNLGWTIIFGGDGMDNEIDPTDENKIYYSFQSGNFYRSIDAGKSFSSMINRNITGVYGQWTTPIRMDPNNPSILYVGYNKLWKSIDNGENWTDFNNTANCTNSCISHIEVAPSNSNYVYYNEYGKMMRSTDGGMTAEERSINIINWIEIDPNDENHLWIISGGSIEESVDGGINWTNINYNLPSGINLTTIAYDHGTNEHLYVGSFQGVYFKDATMNEWLSFSNLLPNVEITELDVVENFNVIRASTYGRGIWESFTVEQEGCHDTIAVNNVINSGIYHASKRIESSGVEFDPRDVQFKAGEEIELMTNFEVKQMATFQAYIESCTSYVPTNLPKGYTCDNTLNLGTNGLINSQGPDKGNGASTITRHAVWYTYDATANGTISVESCGQNTNLNIWTGTCGNLVLLAESINACTNPSIGSSVLLLPISSGQKIFLEWDSLKGVDAFDFNFTFDSP